MLDEPVSGKKANLANGCLRPCLKHHKKCDKENKGWSATNWIKEWGLVLTSSCLELPMIIKIKNGNRMKHQENLEDTMEEENPPQLSRNNVMMLRRKPTPKSERTNSIVGCPGRNTVWRHTWLFLPYAVSKPVHPHRAVGRLGKVQTKTTKQARNLERPKELGSLD